MLISHKNIDCTVPTKEKLNQKHTQLLVDLNFQETQLKLFNIVNIYQTFILLLLIIVKRSNII